MARSAVSYTLAIGLVLAARGQASLVGQLPPGMSRSVLVDNASVLVTHLGYEAGTGEASHTHPFSAVVVQLTPGDVDMTIGSEHSRSRRDVGAVWFIPANVPHAAINAGATMFEQVAVAIKPDRSLAPSSPASDAPPGITRTQLLDNQEARVVRVRFAPGAREPNHSHPNDLVTVQLTEGKVQILVDSETTADSRPPGSVHFVPRGQQHAYGNVDSKVFELMSVAIK
jgi:quercetin dioxygenase-like cupin family protein